MRTMGITATKGAVYLPAETVQEKKRKKIQREMFIREKKARGYLFHFTF